jgi:putative transposase
MSRSLTEIYLHFVWATKKREPVLTAQCEPIVYRCIQKECWRLGVTVLALGGLEDHVHLLAVMPGHVSASHLMQQVKGVSARFANGELPQTMFLQWQEGYHALSVSRPHVQRVKQYVLCQKQHHADANLWQDWEQNADD